MDAEKAIIITPKTLTTETSTAKSVILAMITIQVTITTITTITPIIKNLQVTTITTITMTRTIITTTMTHITIIIAIFPPIPHLLTTMILVLHLVITESVNCNSQQLD